MTEFQAAGEVEGLFGHEIAVGLEEHDGDGSPGNDIAGNEFGENVEIYLLVGDRIKDAEREDEDRADDNGEDKGPKWHLSVVDLDSNRSHDKGEDEKDSEPPVGNVTVAGHEATVDILFFPDAGAELLHDITSIPQVGMGDDGGESGKVESVIEGETEGEEDGGVVAVFLRIENAVGEDLENIEWGASVRVGLTGSDREVGRVQSVGEVQDGDDKPEPEQERYYGVHLGPPLERRSGPATRKKKKSERDLRGRSGGFLCTKSRTSRK